MRWLLLPIPFLVPPVLHAVYEPINRNWTVIRFGCGCPPKLGDAPWFNANVFNLMLWGVVFVLLAAVFHWMVHRFFRRRQFEAFVGGSVILFFMCHHYYGIGVWS